jgi:ABC-type spermidine/putrescine transport system permease subunit I
MNASKLLGTRWFNIFNFGILPLSILGLASNAIVILANWNDLPKLSDYVGSPAILFSGVIVAFGVQIALFVACGVVNRGFGGF